MKNNNFAINTAMWRIPAQSVLAGRRPQAGLFCRHHRAIVAALEQGDAEAAGRAMEEHMRSVKHHMIAITRERERPVSDPLE